MREHIVTVEKILECDPCWKLPDGSYDVDAIRDVVGDGITDLDLLRKAGTGRLTHLDAIWLVTRPGVLSSEIVQKWLEVVVTRAVANYAVGTVIDAWAKRWLSGENRSASAAFATARAAWESAWSAAWKASAWSDAADAAARFERSQQVADLIAILEEES